MNSELTLTYYIQYIKTTYYDVFVHHKNALLVLSLGLGGLYNIANSIALGLGVHILFLVAYILLVLSDVVTGISASVFVNKQPFSSGRFFKKIALSGFSLFLLLITEWITIIFTDYGVNKSQILVGLLSIIVLLTHIIKILFMLMFLIYELTSLRENFVKLKLYEFVRIVDLLLIPLNKIEDYFNKKFDKTIQDDLQNNTTIATNDVMQQEDNTGDNADSN